MNEETREKRLEEIWERFEMCGCGDTEETLMFVRDCLALIKARTDCVADLSMTEVRQGVNDAEWQTAKQYLRNLFTCDGSFFLMMHFLDSEGLTEHGTIVSGSWLTDEGEKLLKELDALSWAEEIG